MAKKIVIINGSPRKNQNTATLQSDGWFRYGCVLHEWLSG